MVERSIFGELLGEIPKECVECCRLEVIPIISTIITVIILMTIIRLEAVTITDSEVKLINEIAMKHSNGVFGKEVYNQRDKMVKCDEFEKFVRFLLFCRKTVVVGESPKEGEGCGVLKVEAGADRTYLPFTMMGGSRWVPLAYFEGEVGGLKAAAKQARGWELAYLRLAGRVAGAGARLEGSACPVVRLDTVLASYSAKPSVKERWKGEVLMKAAESAYSATWVVMCRSGPRSRYKGKMTQIKEFPEDGEGPAYRQVDTSVEDLRLVGVNCRPRQWHDLLLPLHDIVAAVPGLDMDKAATVMADKGANVFQGNAGQAEVLEREGKAAMWDPVPLVRAGDARTALPALRVEADKAEAARKRKWMYDSDSDSD